MKPQNLAAKGRELNYSLNLKAKNPNQGTPKAWAFAKPTATRKRTDRTPTTKIE